METKRIIELAEKAGAFPAGPGDDNSFGFRERALERFAKMIAAECVSICNERAESAEFSYTPAKAVVARRTAEGCATIIKRKFEIE
jgi:hypothetical protein